MKVLILLLLFSCLVGVASASISYETTYWNLESVDGIDIHVDTRVDKENTLKLTLLENSREYQDLGEKDKDTFKKYPVRIYYRTLEKNKINSYILDEDLKLLDEYTIDLNKAKTFGLKLKKYPNWDRLVMKIGENSITYNAGSDAIVITREPGLGDSWKNALNFTYIYQIDQANGWNQIEMIGSNCFYIKCRLQLGNFSTGIYFYDTNKLVEFERDQDLRIYNGWFKTGDLLNESLKMTGNGCNIILNTSLYRYIYFYKANPYIYDTNFKQLDSEHGQFYLYSWTNTDIRFWGVKINDFYSIRNYGLYDIDEEVWYDTIMKNCTYGIQTSGSQYPKTFSDDLTIYNSQDAFYLSWASYPMYIWNSKTMNIQDENIYLYRCNNDIHFINCDLEQWNLRVTINMGYYWRLYREYTYDLITTPNALVTIMNNSATVFRGQAFSNGTIPTLILVCGSWKKHPTQILLDESDMRSHNPYSIEIKKPGYHTYKQKFCLEDACNWQIRLVPDCIQVGTEIIRPRRRL